MRDCKTYNNKNVNKVVQLISLILRSMLFINCVKVNKNEKYVNSGFFFKQWSKYIYLITLFLH